ncbi:hypothetical protein JAAARDRAFT_196886 [Jaapia argillacea MUCL 33604]|uniref:DNA2/NAM7 helicase-like C-terminal domain-containing protein n=1 Tax=Jaapia argillacea MUCL 33604 TaxID=933084 RepID=A0A067PJW5_9AGAM|nr:hypothetical protein JAAARDRAFT_196886 [Jaapia argillacea MUCL 33604]
MKTSGQSAKNVAKCTEVQDDPSHSSPGSDRSELSHDEAMGDDNSPFRPQEEALIIPKTVGASQDARNHSIQPAGGHVWAWDQENARVRHRLHRFPLKSCIRRSCPPILLSRPNPPPTSPRAEREIGTVDGMQGLEKEAIAISPVRCNEQREVGFLKDKRSLNVYRYDLSQETPRSYSEYSFHPLLALTYQQCIVRDSSTVEHGSSFLKEWLKWLAYNADV